MTRSFRWATDRRTRQCHHRRPATAAATAASSRTGTRTGTGPTAAGRSIFPRVSEAEAARHRCARRMIRSGGGHVHEHIPKLRVVRQGPPGADRRAERDHRLVLRRPIERPARDEVVLVPEIGAELFDLRRHLVDVRAGHAEQTGRWRLDGNRLRWPVLVVGRTAPVHRLFKELVERFSRDAVEHIHEVKFPGLKHGRNRTTVDLHVHQDRRRRHVPVRRVVVHELMEPLQFAGLRVQCDQRIAVQIAALDGTVGIAGGAKDETGRLIRGEIRPDVAAAAVLECVAGPVFMVRLARPRNGMEGPDEFSRRRIPGSDVAARLRWWQFARPGARDEQILVNRHRIRNGERVAPVLRHRG